MWLVYSLVIALITEALLVWFYKKRPPIPIEAAWNFLTISTFFKWLYSGELAAANHALPALVLVGFIHLGVWLYQKNKRPEQPAVTQTIQPALEQVTPTAINGQDISPTVKYPLLKIFIVAMAILIFIAALTISENDVAPQPISPPTQEQQLEIEMTKLTKVHADAIQIANDPAFQDWVTKQPPAIQKMYGSQLADDNIALLSLYKSDIARQKKQFRADVINKALNEKEPENTQLTLEALPATDKEPFFHLFTGNGLQFTQKAHAQIPNPEQLKGNEANKFKGGIYTGYVIGVVDTAANTLFCPPASFEMQQALDISAAYIQGNPERRHFSAARLIVEALSQKYPCKKAAQ